MDAIQKAPLIKYLLPLLAGIIFAYHFNIFSALEALGISLGFLTIFILIQMSILSQSYTHRWMPGLSISLCLFFTGIILIQSYELTSKSNFFGKAKENIYYYEYKILEPLQEKENTYKCRAEVQHIIYKKEAGSNNWYRKKTIGYVQLYFEKTPNSAMLKYGDIIYASQSPSAISPPVNPGEFDMQSYLKLKQIYHSSYLKDKDYLLLPNNHGNIFWKIVYNTKSKLSEYFNQHIKNKDELSIIKALVLGDEAEVSPELIDDYSASGTLHILSVSGLHIGILFYLLSNIFIFLKPFRGGKFLRLFLIISFLWAYAFITGSSAAVCRSVAMFSFVLIGQNLRRESNIFNAIALSMFLLLLLDPYQLFQASFQLSYLALIGIILLQPYIFKWWHLTPFTSSKQEHFLLKLSKKYIFKLWRGIWALSSVSIAAQLAVLPISLYYFNRFPFYFILSNLIIIPLSSIVLILGCVFLIIQIFPTNILSTLISNLIVYTTKWMNNIVHFEHALPYSQSQGIYLNLAECLVLYTCIIFICLAFISKRKKILIVSLAILLVFTGEQSMAKTINYSKSFLRIHAIRKHFAMSIKHKDQLYILTDRSLYKDKRKLNYYFNKYSFINYISNDHLKIYPIDSLAAINQGQLQIKTPIISYKGTSFLLLSSPNKIDYLSKKLDVDYIVLHDNPELKLDSIISKIQFRKLIINPSNSIRNAEKWENECIRNFIPYLMLQKDNSFVLKF